MRKFLSETRFCDHSHPLIRSIAEEIFEGAADDVEVAVRAFEWVRDRVLYRFDYWAVRASETARKRRGMCANKANLQVALLRAAGVPAGYHLMRIRKEVLKPVAEPTLYSLTRPVTLHVFCSVFLNGRWISADATVDGQLYKAAYADRPGWSYGRWDGNFDYEIDRSFVVEDLGIRADIDDLLATPPRFLDDELLFRANLYIEELLRRAG